MQPKPYNDELEFKFISMVQLAEMRDTMIREMHLQLAVDEITADLVRELSEKVRASEGSTTLRVNVCDPKAQVSVSLFSRSHKVCLSADLVSFLDEREIRYTIS